MGFFIQIFFISAFIILIKPVNDQKIIISDFQKNRGEYTVGVSMKDLVWHPYFRINLSNNFLWFSFISSSFLERIKNEDTISIPITEKISEPAIQEKGTFGLFGRKIEVNNYIFYIVPKKINYIKESLGLGLVFENENYSFIHGLKREGLIDHLSFGFHLSIYNGTGEFYLGGIPNNITSKMTKGSCKADIATKLWGCYLTSINIENSKKNGKIIFKEKYGIFLTHYPYIRIPESAYQEIVTKYFSEFLKNSICTMTNNILSCNMKNTIMKSIIYFDFKGFSLSFNIMTLFETGCTMCEFFIRGKKDNFKEDLDYDLIFGTSFLKPFASQFDYETQEVIFYGKNSIHFYKSYPKQLLLGFQIVQSGLLALASAFLLTIKYQIKSFLSKKNESL